MSERNKTSIAPMIEAAAKAYSEDRPTDDGWQPMASAPDGFDENYFLIRPRGVSPRTGGAYVPTVVFRDGAHVYGPDNHLRPLQWSRDNIDITKGCTPDVFLADLEWRPLP